jgi:hypothetical protein
LRECAGRGSARGRGGGAPGGGGIKFNNYQFMWESMKKNFTQIFKKKEVSKLESEFKKFERGLAQWEESYFHVVWQMVSLSLNLFRDLFSLDFIIAPKAHRFNYLSMDFQSLNPQCPST